MYWKQVSAVANRPARQNRAVDRARRSSVIIATAVERRSSEVLSTQLIDDGPAVQHALSVHLSRAKSIIRFNDRYARVLEKFPERSALSFEGTRISF